MNVRMMGYFARQAAVADFGPHSLEKLKASNLAIVVTGGVGSATAYQLASLGIGKMKLIDQDIVEESNLHRLVGLDSRAMNKPKAEALAEELNSRHSWTRSLPVVETLRASNCEDLLHDIDLIVDGTDNFRTRYVLNRFSVKNKIPYLFTSAIANQGHLSLFNPPGTPCLECTISETLYSSSENCETVGVTPTIVATVGALAAAEAAKTILGQPTTLLGNLLTIDLAGPDFVYSRISRRDACGACGNSRSERMQADNVTVLCGENTANILPDHDLNLDLSSLQVLIPRESVLVSTGSVLVFTREHHRVSMFKTGRLLISNVNSEDEARKLAGEIWEEMLLPA
jgi:adenylyltransferase/sulfurtransferase